MERRPLGINKLTTLMTMKIVLSSSTWEKQDESGVMARMYRQARIAQRMYTKGNDALDLSRGPVRIITECAVGEYNYTKIYVPVDERAGNEDGNEMCQFAVRGNEF